MRDGGLAVGWIAVAVLFVLALVWELNAWQSQSTRAAAASVERARLAGEVRGKQEEIVSEMRAHAGLLQEMQWTSSGGDPGAFLARLADLAQGARMKITAIGPLERQSTPQFSKSWHAIQIVGPYRELRDLAIRVERERGILEDVRLELPSESAGRGAQGPDELRAQLKMTALELSPEARRVLDRAVAAQGQAKRGPGAAGPSLALPLPRRSADIGPPIRDPFSYATAPLPGRVAGRPRAPGPSVSAPAPTPPASAAPPLAPLQVTGIVGFPGGSLAIVNDQIVKVGDTVNGHRVERIADREVVFQQPDGSPRTVILTELGAASPGARRR